VFSKAKGNYFFADTTAKPLGSPLRGPILLSYTPGSLRSPGAIQDMPPLGTGLEFFAASGMVFVILNSCMPLACLIIGILACLWHGICYLVPAQRDWLTPGICYFLIIWFLEFSSLLCLFFGFCYLKFYHSGLQCPIIVSSLSQISGL